MIVNNIGTGPGEPKVKKVFSRLELKRCKNSVSICLEVVKTFHDGNKRTTTTFFDIPSDCYEEAKLLFS